MIPDQSALRVFLLISLVMMLSACGNSNRSSGSGVLITVSEPGEGSINLPSVGLRDLAALGYEELELFIEGQAESYQLEGERSSDGLWQAKRKDSEDYKTRVVVRRPVAAADFSGVVVVEWMNVTAGLDGDPDWAYISEELLREGHAYIGVSTQYVGVHGGGGLLGDLGGEGGLVAADPERYGSLLHPGDAYAFDIFTQVGMAIDSGRGEALLGDLDATTIIAIGESQSAFFLTTYVNAIHPLKQVYDGFLIHSRGGGSVGLEGFSLDVDPDTTATPAQFFEQVHVRTDLAEPVLIFETETDLIELGYFGSRQDDTDSVRLWEVAGTAHADNFIIAQSYGAAASALVGSLFNCPAPLNNGPQHEVLQAAFHHLVNWVREGDLPPAAPRLEIDATTTPTILRDQYGNALGGIRTPLVDVPLETLSGSAVPGGNVFCFLFGSTDVFEADLRNQLYVDKAAYLDAYSAATEDAVTKGFLLRPDADDMLARAAAREF